MGVKYKFDGNLLLMTLHGVCPVEDFIDTFDKALIDPAFPKNARFLLDVSASISLADRSVDELRQVVDHFGPRAGRVGRRCALVAQSPVHFGLMRIAVAFSELHGVTANVFRTVEDAVEWLNQDLPTVVD